MVGRVAFGASSEVTFEPKYHRYHNTSGQEYRSVSKLLNSIEVPFDRQGISMAMAKGSKAKQAEILAEWDRKRDSSIERGNWIHDNLEKFHKLGICDDALSPVVQQIKPLYKDYFRVYTEVLVSNSEYKVAGQTDLVVQRQRSKNSLYDFYDYKTNESKGIQFDSIGRKKHPWSHYNKFFLHPLDHIENCNYNRYSLQLSLYACIAQRQYGIHIGRLALIFIDNELRVHIYPVPFLRFEAEVLLEHSTKALKPLPQIQEPAWRNEQPQDENENDW